ncbi:ATPase H+ transporting accessory protein 1a [Pristis pectinata]|uniref:ATPase H+ transporting accessory protein 1a n=1 Tax=Pristis pectinata TaxID=685728 RepID=UPI00223CCAA4|nr:ATPase H+ transporting accessory protein 1a [Pristis pectinata]
MAAAAAAWLLALALGSALGGGRGTDQVPVLAWSTEGSLWRSRPAPNGGHIVSQQQLASYLDPALAKGPKTVILFLQDKLSVDDFTVYGGVYGNKQESAFPNLQAALESSPSSLVLPSVDWHATSSLLLSLQSSVGTSPLYVDPLTIPRSPAQRQRPSLLAVRLPYSSGSILIRPKEALTANDNILGKVLDVLKEDGVPFTAVLTAARPSRVVREVSAPPVGPGRQLLAAEDEREGPHPPLAFNVSGSPCILLWASRLVLGRGPSEADLTNRTFGPSASVSLHSSACANHSADLVLEYSNVEKLGTVKIVFKMSNQSYRVSAQPWFTLDQVEVTSDKDVIAFNVSDVYAPAAYSYRCSSVSNDPRAGSVLRSSTSSSQTWKLYLQDFQIQAFGVKGMRFSYASDCSGFFTPAIWMGLITSLLMVFILTYGLHMVTSLKTMDRFDDPKGPSISVPQTE